MKPYNEVRLGQAHNADVLIGVTCGVLLAAVFVYDLSQRIAGWLIG